MPAIPLQINSPTNMADPSTNAAAVTPNDATDLAYTTNRIWVGGTGALAVTLPGMAAGTSVTISGIPAGTMLPLSATRIWATNTTATLIVAFWR